MTEAKETEIDIRGPVNGWHRLAEAADEVRFVKRELGESPEKRFAREEAEQAKKSK